MSQLEEARRKILLDLWGKGDIDDVLVKNIELELDLEDLEEQLTLPRRNPLEFFKGVCLNDRTLKIQSQKR